MTPKVHFIGAGPGDPELLTLKAARLIAACPVCLYAGSLVPEAVVQTAPEGALVVDTAPLNLDQIMDLIEQAIAAGKSVARVHSGDPSLYGATAEQIRRLKAVGIAYDITPGVPAFAAAAAALGQELTLPDVGQSLIVTRTAMKASAMPNREELAVFGQSGATLAIHLSIRNFRKIEQDLIPLYGPDCPVVVAYRVGWPDQSFIRATLATFAAKARAAKITRTAIVFVGRVLDAEGGFTDSALYDPDHVHILRHRNSKVDMPCIDS